MTAPIPASLATACAAHDRHRLDVLDALLDEAAPSAVRELLGAALDLCATLRADRDELRARLDAAPKVCAIHSYEHGPGPCMTCGAWPPGTRELIATCRTRIAGLEQAADERSKEVARLTARVAELEARPVLTVDRIDYALAHSGRRLVDETGRTSSASDIMRHLGPVTLPPAQDRAEEIVAPVDPEAVARTYHDNGTGPSSVVLPYWGDLTERQRVAAIAAMRATLTAAGIPVTPEVGK